VRDTHSKGGCWNSGRFTENCWVLTSSLALSKNYRIHRKVWGSHGGDYEECRLLGYKNPVLPHRKHYLSAIEPSRLILCKIEIYTAVTMKNDDFWDVTSCDYCENRSFGGACRLGGDTVPSYKSHTTSHPRRRHSFSRSHRLANSAHYPCPIFYLNTTFRRLHCLRPQVESVRRQSSTICWSLLSRFHLQTESLRNIVFKLKTGRWMCTELW
jgi:hypothetical protein